MNEVISNVLSGNPFKAITSLFNESPQENVREAVVDLLDGKDPEKNMAKLQEQLSRPGGDTDKLDQIRALVGADGGQPSTETLEKMLAVLKPEEAEKRGVSGASLMSFGGASKPSGADAFVNF